MLACMNDLDRQLLALFDELGEEKLDLHAFFDVVGGNTAADQERVLAAVERLVASGELEDRGNDFYSRTEKGKREAREPR